MTDDRTTGWRSWIRLALQRAGVCMLVIYLTAYATLSRRGRAEAIRYRTEGFYYLRLDTYSDANKKTWQFQERALTILFWPVNFVDAWFNPAMHHGWHAFCEIDLST